MYSKHNGQYYLALVHDVFGHWTLSKGENWDNPAIESETAEEGTIREIKEEIGLDIIIEQKLVRTSMPLHTPSVEVSQARDLFSCTRRV